MWLTSNVLNYQKRTPQESWPVINPSECLQPPLNFVCNRRNSSKVLLWNHTKLMLPQVSVALLVVDPQDFKCWPSQCLLVQGSHSGVSTHLPPIWVRLSYQTWRLIYGLSLLVLYSLLRGFSLRNPVFPSPQEPTNCVNY